MFRDLGGSFPEIGDPNIDPRLEAEKSSGFRN